MLTSPLSAAAIAISCCSQSQYAIANPGGGWMRHRNHFDGPKMNLEFDGWLRPVFAANAERRQRFRPSLPTASDSSRSADMACRSSASAPTAGYALAMSENTSPSSASAPVASRGHAMRRSASHRSNSFTLNVVPSYTP